MEEKLENVWKKYEEKPDPLLLVLYLEKILRQNPDCLDEYYSNCGEIPIEGPHLFTLAENLLEECDKYLKVVVSKGQNIDEETLRRTGILIKALCIICRNFDNIPFVSSCEIVNYIMELASTIVAEFLQFESSCEFTDHKVTLLKCVFTFLEIIYDPYSTWRAWLAKKPINRTLFQFRPAVLHVEVVPFFYDALHYEPSRLPNKVQIHLLHVYGAIISGAQHNALSAVTPATLEVLFKLVLEPKLTCEVHVLALKCVTCSVGCIRGCVDQRQVDVRTVVESFFGNLINMCSESDFKNKIPSVITMLGGLQDMLNYHEEISVRKIMQENDYLNFLMNQIQKSHQAEKQIRQRLTIAVLDTITAFIGRGIWPKRHFLAVVGFESLDKVLKSVGEPCQKLIDGIFRLTLEGLETNSKSIRNGQLANTLLNLLLYISDVELQLNIVEKLLSLCDADLYSRIVCCQCGAIRTIIRILEKYTRLGGRTLGKLLRLLEVLGSHSIQPSELKLLFHLLRIDKDGKQFAYTVQVIHILSTMTKNQAWQGASRFFDLREKFDGIGIHSVRKWPGTAFGFHVWLRLNKENIQGNVRQRRQLYSFLNTNNGGFEAFFTEEHQLVIAVAMKKDYYATAVVDNPFDDEKWHSVAICHSPARRPFTQSSLTVYIDGRQKLVAQLKFPVLTEPFVYCRVGVGGQITSLSGRRHSDASDMSERSGFMSTFSDAAFGQLTTFIDKDRLFALGSKTLPHALRGAFSASEPDPSVQSCQIGTQDTVWGAPNCLNGQIGSMSLTHEVFLPNQVKALYEAGPDCVSLLSSEDSPEFIDFTNKLIFHWDAKAYHGEICIDLSPSHMYDGQVTGNHCDTVNIKDSLNCIGGVSSLYPLLENAGKNANPMCNDFSGLSPQKPPLIAQMSEDQLNEEWVVLPSSSYSEWKLEQNQVAGFILFLLHAIQGNLDNQEQVLRQNGLDTIGALMQKVPNHLIDVNVLMATQLVVEGVSGCDNAADLLRAVYQFILFDFRIWSKGNFPVRIGHIQYLSTIIKDDRKFFRKKYGPQFFLDTIQTFYSSCDSINSEDIKTIRISLIGLIKYYLTRDINVQEISGVINYIISSKEEQLVFEMIEMLFNLLENNLAKDQLYLLLYEPGAGEMLYCILFNSNYSTLLKVKVLKIINLLLKSERVYEKSKTRLRLHDLGFSCLLTFLNPTHVSMEMIMLLTEQTLMTETVYAYQGLLSILHFIKHMDVEIKLETAKKLLNRLEQKPNSMMLITKQIGWQECVLSMLVKQAITGKPIPITPLPSLDLIDLSNESIEETDVTKSESPIFNRSTPRRLSRRSSTSLRSLEDSSASPLPPRTPQFLMQLKEHIFDFDFPQLLGRSRSGSRSSSTEDLSSVLNNDGSSRKSCTSLSGVAMAELDKLIMEGTAAQNAAKALSVTTVSEVASHQEQELCTYVADITYLLMWKGVDGSGKSAWQERGMIFAYINLLALSNELYMSHLEVKRLILEKALQACLLDLQEAGQANATHTENAIELMKLVYDFVVLENVDDNRRLSEKLLESVLGLLDVLLVFEYSPGQEGWVEMAEMGLGVVLVCSATENLELCAMATAKLHALVQTRPFASLEEACHLLATLDNILNKAIESGDQEHYSFLIPVVRALLEKLSPPLHLQRHLPGLPLASASGPAFFEDFQHYAISSEWKNFIEKTILPLQRKYTCLRVDEQKDQMNGFWNQCYELSMISSHKRNREIGESKLRFQSNIMDVFQTKVAEENSRYQSMLTSLKHQNIFVRRRWRMLKLHLYGPRGPWESSVPLVQHWKLSNHENSSRMRLKMTFNLNFDLHMQGSRLRDNQGTGNNSVSGMRSLPPVAREAKVAQLQEDSLGDEDLQVSASEIEGLNETEKEKTVISDDCELVTLLSVVKGRFEVTTSDIYFLDLSTLKEEGERYDFKCPLANLREIHLRRYNLRRSALEFFLVDQTNFFLNFTTKTRNKIYSRIISQRPPNLYYSYGIRSPAELLKASGVTQKWMQREMSNFEYLMVLNTIAGRTYNDLSQYPVFPWILADYVSTELDLDNPAVYRDLSKPIAIVNPKNIQEVKTKYDNFVDISGVVEKFHYGTHYSNSAGVLHYLVRVEPFTSLHIELQGGRFDVADRQFHSLEATWRMLMDNPNDCKELIPEFFYLPEFLTNMNGFDLGRLQVTKDRVDNVKLPPWASSPEDFINKHRKALESEFVSSHLHEWIDLIFGYKQKGPAAVESLNVFYYVSYEGAVDLDAIQDPVERAATEGMINHFGQTPCQLLKEPHPRRMAFEEAMVRMTKNDTKPPSLYMFLQNLRTFFVEAYPTTTPIAFISLPKNQAKTFRQTTTTDSLITVCQNGILGVHSWLPYDKAKTIPFYYTFDKDPSLASNKTIRRVSGPFHPSVDVTHKLFAISLDAKLLISGGHWDNSIRAFSLVKSKNVTIIIKHLDIVTCLSLDAGGKHLISGSKDTTCMIWQLKQTNSGLVLMNKQLQTLYGHDDEVTSVGLAMDLDMAVSGSKDGSVNIHTVRDGHFMRTLSPPSSDPANQEVSLLSLSPIGLLCVFCKQKDKAKGGDHCLHLYSINGKHLTQRSMSSCLTDIQVTGEYLVTSSVEGIISVFDVLRFQILTEIPFHIPVMTVCVTMGNSHILASLDDGKIIIIGSRPNIQK